MTKFYLLIICFLSGVFVYGQDPCEDVNAFTFHTPCGDEFALCMDRYELENHQSVELQVYTNDMGQIDKCNSYICEPCNHGVLLKLPSPNCNYVYTPDDGYYGNDTFYYSMVINDSCSDEPCEGKIWTVNSRYTGPNGLYVKAFYKHGSNWEAFDDVYDLQWGEYFLIDGSSLPVSQTQWKYKFYEPETEGGCVGEDCLVDEEIVHTSCSEVIFGKNYGMFRVISGCTAHPLSGEDCYDQGNNPGSTNMITTQYTDTAMVVITIKALPIEITDFKVLATRNGNLISWNVESVVNEDYIEIQRSSNEMNFESIAKVAPIPLGLNSYLDTEAMDKSNVYYRLAIVDLDGHKKYSKILSVNRHDISDLKVYPNPTSNALLINTGNIEFKVVNFTLIDMSGKLITKRNLPPSSTQVIHLSNYNLSTGIYVLQISTEDGQRVSKEVMYSQSYKN